MNLMWRTEGGNSPECAIHHTCIEVTSDDEMQQAIDSCIEKACGLLEHNIRDESRYLLFGWEPGTSTLSIVVTDDEKACDSPHTVRCHFIANAEQLDPEDIQYWIKDYLTTCAPFLRYSLIAAFHRESRASCVLL